MTHPTQLELAGYRRGRLPAPEMLAIDDHVAVCDACRHLLRESELLAQPAAVLAQLGEPHLSYEAMEAYVDGLVPVQQQPQMHAHLELCLQCREEVADLEELRRSVAPARSRHFLGGLAAAAAILLAIGAVWLWSNAHRAPDLAQMALATGELGIPEDILALHAPRPAVRASETGANFLLATPVGTAVVDGRPKFTWQPLAGAAGYRVAVFAPGFRKVVESDWLQATAWEPPQPLDSGQVYSWQVTARLGSGEDAPTVRAPGLTDSEAKFKVLGASEAAALRQAVEVPGASHLFRGELYARAGVLDRAEEELAAYVAANPQSAQAAALLERLRAVRR